MNPKTLTAAVAVAAGLLAGGVAQARPDVQWSVTVGQGRAPVLVQPAPVYRPAPRVVVVPAPVLRRHGRPWVATRWDRDGDGWSNRADRFPDHPWRR